MQSREKISKEKIKNILTDVLYVLMNNDRIGLNIQENTNLKDYLATFDSLQWVELSAILSNELDINIDLTKMQQKIRTKKNIYVDLLVEEIYSQVDQ